MFGLNILNDHFLEDFQADTKKIIGYFRKTPEKHILIALSHTYSFSSLASSTHPQPTEFIFNVFSSIIHQIYVSIIQDDWLMFVLLIFMLENVYFHQKINIIKITINIEKLESINEYLDFQDKISQDLAHREMHNLCIENIDRLKYYQAFDVYIDEKSFCLPDNDVEIVLKEIDRYGELLSDLEMEIDSVINKDFF